MTYYSMSITYCHSYYQTDLPMIGEYIKSNSWYYSTTIHHCYYLSNEEASNDDGTTGKTAKQFQSGEVAWLLNKGTVGTSGSATTDGTQSWYQDLGSDLYPTFTGKTVYHGYQSCLSEDAEYANTALNPDKSHSYTLAPYFSWSADYKSCSAIFMCVCDINHETCEVQCEMSFDTSDPNKTICTASVTMAGKTYTDSRTTQNAVISVTVSWSEMEFDYTAGEWDAENHKYAVGEWTPTYANGDSLTITNAGNVKLDVSVSYEQTENSGVEGTVTVEDSETGTFILGIEAEKRVSLSLSGEPNEHVKHELVGNVILYLGSSVLDLTDVAVADYTDTIVSYMADGSPQLTLRLGQDTLTTEMGNAITAALTQAEITDCKLTLLDTVTIEMDAFKNCTNLKEVYLPEVKTLNKSVFSGCTALTKAYCPVAETLGTDFTAYYSGWIFTDCENLEEIILPKAKIIGYATFEDCTSLKYANLPTATLLEERAFNKCKALEDIYLPQVITIGDNVFSSCDAVKSVNAPLATTVGARVFWSDKVLQYVRLPEVTTLGEHAFANDSALQTVSFPKLTALSNAVFSNAGLVSATFPSVTSIGDSALWCVNLRTLTFQSVITDIGTAWLDNGAYGKVALTVHEKQVDSETCPADLDKKTFGGYAFQSIQVYSEN